MIPFLSCDWGTSSFRLSLVDADNFNVLAIETTGKGILPTYNNWKESRNTDPSTRLSFYLAIIQEYIIALEKKAGIAINGAPLLISGMASSSIGLKPLPYHVMPFSIDGSGIQSEYLSLTPDFKHDVLLISGVSSGEDVMRGEETQLIGIVPDDAVFTGNQLFIFPGTHSKHIIVNGNQAISFKTFMTGEFFDLLSKKSILQDSLEQEDGLQTPEAKNCFEKAVREGSESNLLNVCFKVRTNILFDKISKKENYHYLSGLLIGAELGEIVQNDTIGIYLCSGAQVKMYYETALEVLGLKNKLYSLPAQSVEKAALKGQYKIYEKHIKR
ncbi:MAG: 2-dehydro-3-deoxygalactonokinase [Chitinophagaceae bacterium]